MESTVCLLTLTSNYHVNVIEIKSILDKENRFKWTYGKLLTTFVSFEREKTHIQYTYTETLSVLNSQTSITQTICMFKILITINCRNFAVTVSIRDKLTFVQST